MALAVSTLRAADSAPGYWRKVHQSNWRQWRKAFPGARLGFLGDSASGGSVLSLIGDERFVRSGIHQRLEFRRIGEAHLHQPSGSVRVGIDLLRRVLQLAVGFDHFTGDWSVNVADSFYGFDRAQGFSRGDLRAGFRKLDENDVAQFMLRGISDADGCHVALRINPFVLVR